MFYDYEDRFIFQEWILFIRIYYSATFFIFIFYLTFLLFTLIFIFMKKDIFGFENQGAKYEKYRIDFPPKFLEQALQKVSNKNNYLDIGTGTGKVLFHIADDFNYSKGIDISEKMIEASLDKVKKLERRIFRFNLWILWTGTVKKNMTWLRWEWLFTTFQENRVYQRWMKRFTMTGFFLFLVILPKRCTIEKEKKGKNIGQLLIGWWITKIIPYFAFKYNELTNYYQVPKVYPFHKYFRYQIEVREIITKLSKEDFFWLF